MDTQTDRRIYLFISLTALLAIVLRPISSQNQYAASQFSPLDRQPPLIFSHAHPSQIVVDSGLKAYPLLCEASSKPASVYTWFFNDRLLTLPGDWQASKNNPGYTAIANISHTLRMDISRKSAGRYRCIANSKMGALRGSAITLKVKYFVDAPSVGAISPSFGSQTVVRGTGSYLLVTAPRLQAFPQPEVEWLWNDIQIKSQEQLTKPSLRLYISTLQRSIVLLSLQSRDDDSIFRGIYSAPSTSSQRNTQTSTAFYNLKVEDFINQEKRVSDAEPVLYPQNVTITYSPEVSIDAMFECVFNARSLSTLKIRWFFTPLTSFGNKSFNSTNSPSFAPLPISLSGSKHDGDYVLEPRYSRWLRIRNLRPDIHQGAYHCQATMEVDADTKKQSRFLTAYLDVWQPPQLTDSSWEIVQNGISIQRKLKPVLTSGRSPSIVTVGWGELLRLGCYFIGAPQPKMSWYFNAVPLSFPLYSTNKMDIISLNEQSNELEFLANEKRSGVYQCFGESTVNNELRDDYHTFWVQVKSEPATIVGSKVVEQLVVEGEKMVKLSCNASGYPTPSIMWQRLNVGSSESSIIGVHAEYIIPMVTFSSAGHYLCQVSNHFGEDTLRIQLLVYKLPQFSKKMMTELHIPVGVSLTLPCELENSSVRDSVSLPPEEVRILGWTRPVTVKETVVNAPSRRVMESLSMTPVYEQDSGMYICRVLILKRLTIEHRFLLNVLTVPSIMKVNSSSQMLSTSGSVNMYLCNVTHGLSIIKHRLYVNRVMKRDKNWYLINEFIDPGLILNGINGNNYDVSKMSAAEQKAYQVAISCINEMGESPKQIFSSLDRSLIENLNRFDEQSDGNVPQIRSIYSTHNSIVINWTMSCRNAANDQLTIFYREFTAWNTSQQMSSDYMWQTRVIPLTHPSGNEPDIIILDRLKSDEIYEIHLKSTSTRNYQSTNSILPLLIRTLTLWDIATKQDSQSIQSVEESTDMSVMGEVASIEMAEDSHDIVANIVLKFTTQSNTVSLSHQAHLFELHCDPSTKCAQQQISLVAPLVGENVTTSFHNLQPCMTYHLWHTLSTGNGKCLYQNLQTTESSKENGMVKVLSFQTPSPPRGATRVTNVTVSRIDPAATEAFTNIRLSWQLPIIFSCIERLQEFQLVYWTDSHSVTDDQQQSTPIRVSLPHTSQEVKDMGHYQHILTNISTNHIVRFTITALWKFGWRDAFVGAFHITSTHPPDPPHGLKFVLCGSETRSMNVKRSICLVYLHDNCGSVSPCTEYILEYQKGGRFKEDYVPLFAKESMNNSWKNNSIAPVEAWTTSAISVEEIEKVEGSSKLERTYYVNVTHLLMASGNGVGQNTNLPYLLNHWLRFRVRVRNVFGWSIPSESTDSVRLPSIRNEASTIVSPCFVPQIQSIRSINSTTLQLTWKIPSLANWPQSAAIQAFYVIQWDVDIRERSLSPTNNRNVADQPRSVQLAVFDTKHFMLPPWYLLTGLISSKSYIIRMRACYGIRGTSDVLFDGSGRCGSWSPWHGPYKTRTSITENIFQPPPRNLTVVRVTEESIHFGFIISSLPMQMKMSTSNAASKSFLQIHVEIYESVTNTLILQHHVSVPRISKVESSPFQYSNILSHELPHCSAYFIRIATLNEWGMSRFSKNVTFSTPDQNVSRTFLFPHNWTRLNSSFYELTWSPVMNDHSCYKGYESGVTYEVSMYSLRSQEPWEMAERTWAIKESQILIESLKMNDMNGAGSMRTILISIRPTWTVSMSQRRTSLTSSTTVSMGVATYFMVQSLEHFHHYLPLMKLTSPTVLRRESHQLSVQWSFYSTQGQFLMQPSHYILTYQTVSSGESVIAPQEQRCLHHWNVELQTCTVSRMSGNSCYTFRVTAHFALLEYSYKTLASEWSHVVCTTLSVVNPIHSFTKSLPIDDVQIWHNSLFTTYSLYHPLFLRLELFLWSRSPDKHANPSSNEVNTPVAPIYRGEYSLTNVTHLSSLLVDGILGNISSTTLCVAQEYFIRFTLIDSDTMECGDNKNINTRPFNSITFSSDMLLPPSSLSASKTTISASSLVTTSNMIVEDLHCELISWLRISCSWRPLTSFQKDNSLTIQFTMVPITPQSKFHLQFESSHLRQRRESLVSAERLETYLTTEESQFEVSVASFGGFDYEIHVKSIVTNTLDPSSMKQSNHLASSFYLPVESNNSLVKCQHLFAASIKFNCQMLTRNSIHIAWQHSHAFDPDQVRISCTWWDKASGLQIYRHKEVPGSQRVHTFTDLPSDTNFTVQLHTRCHQLWGTPAALKPSSLELFTGSQPSKGPPAIQIHQMWIDHDTKSVKIQWDMSSVSTSSFTRIYYLVEAKESSSTNDWFHILTLSKKDMDGQKGVFSVPLSNLTSGHIYEFRVLSTSENVIGGISDVTVPLTWPTADESAASAGMTIMPRHIWYIIAAGASLFILLTLGMLLIYCLCKYILMKSPNHANASTVNASTMSTHHLTIGNPYGNGPSKGMSGSFLRDSHSISTCNSPVNVPLPKDIRCVGGFMTCCAHPQFASFDRHPYPRPPSRQCSYSPVYLEMRTSPTNYPMEHLLMDTKHSIGTGEESIDMRSNAFSMGSHPLHGVLSGSCHSSIQPCSTMKSRDSSSALNGEDPNNSFSVPFNAPYGIENGNVLNGMPYPYRHGGMVPDHRGHMSLIPVANLPNIQLKNVPRPPTYPYYVQQSNPQFMADARTPTNESSASFREFSFGHDSYVPLLPLNSGAYPNQRVTDIVDSQSSFGLSGGEDEKFKLTAENINAAQLNSFHPLGSNPIRQVTYSDLPPMSNTVSRESDSSNIPLLNSFKQHSNYEIRSLDGGTNDTVASPVSQFAPSDNPPCSVPTSWIANQSIHPNQINHPPRNGISHSTAYS